MNRHKEIDRVLADFVFDGLPERESAEVRAHLGRCRRCREELKRLETLRECAGSARNLSIDDCECDSAKQTLFAAVEREGTTEQTVRPGFGLALLGRTIMKSRWIKLGTAAAVLGAVALFVALVGDRSAGSAYAIGQTIDANHSVRSIYLKHFFRGYPDKPMELWAEFGESGDLIRCRMQQPRLDPNMGDGYKIAVWSDNRSDLWFKDQKVYMITRDDVSASYICQGIREIDPKSCVERLQALEAEGKVRIEITEPSEPGQAITVTATYLPQSDSPNKRLVIYVDPDTKLVRKIETYEMENGEYQLTGQDEIVEYNKPIDPALFVLNVPDDVQRIDQFTQEVGLEQGGSSQEDIAVQVVRQTLDALIAGDYAKAGRLMGGVSPDEVARQARAARIVRVVSIGKAERHPQWPILLVPVELELEKDGRIKVRSSKWRVQELRTQPGRWVTQR